MWTGNPEQPEATCLAILKNGRIGYVGNLKGAEALRPPSAPLVDLNGLFVVPVRRISWSWGSQYYAVGPEIHFSHHFSNNRTIVLRVQYNTGSLAGFH